VGDDVEYVVEKKLTACRFRWFMKTVCLQGGNPRDGLVGEDVTQILKP